jgi:hypothetical protein
MKTRDSLEKAVQSGLIRGAGPSQQFTAAQITAIQADQTAVASISIPDSGFEIPDFD